VVDASNPPAVVGPVIGLDAGSPLVGFKSNGAVFALRLDFGTLVGGLVFFDSDSCGAQASEVHGFVPPSSTAFRAAAVDNGGRVWVEDAAALPVDFLPLSYVWSGECFGYDSSNGPVTLAPAIVAVDLATQFMQPFQIQ
jgi:hypothetical protein